MAYSIPSTIPARSALVIERGGHCQVPDVGASTAAMRARRGPLRASWERTPRSLLIVIPARSYPMGKFFLAVIIVSLAIIIAIAVFAVML